MGIRYSYIEPLPWQKRMAQNNLYIYIFLWFILAIFFQGAAGTEGIDGLGGFLYFHFIFKIVDAWNGLEQANLTNGRSRWDWLGYILAVCGAETSARGACFLSIITLLGILSSYCVAFTHISLLGKFYLIIIPLLGISIIAALINWRERKTLFNENRKALRNFIKKNIVTEQEDVNQKCFRRDPFTGKSYPC